jgi:hypothetical protein
MLPPGRNKNAEALGRAAQMLLYWHDSDIQALLAVLGKVSDLDEAKDIMLSMAMLASGNDQLLREITLKNVAIT